MRSSYIDNHFDKIIENYVLTWQPQKLVELGILDGFSTIAIAKGMQQVEQLRHWNMPKLDAYDLFDDYKYKHGNQSNIQSALINLGLDKYVNLQKGDAYEVYKNYPDVKDGVRGIEFLHIDISNTGDTLKKIIELWHPKIGARGLILIEGGSEERDNVEWMKKYNMPSIKKEIETNEIINKFYEYGTYYRFPSMTVLIRKWYD